MPREKLHPRRTFEDARAYLSKDPKLQTVKTGEKVASEIALPHRIEIFDEDLRDVIAFMASEYRVYKEFQRKHGIFAYEYGELEFEQNFKKTWALLKRLGLEHFLDAAAKIVDLDMTPNPFENMDR